MLPAKWTWSQMPVSGLYLPLSHFDGRSDRARERRVASRLHLVAFAGLEVLDADPHEGADD